jgi:beta-mannosidase
MKRIGLEGTWKLTRVSDGSSRPMAVPGDIASALIRSGEIPDPYFGRNELETLWVGREDWFLERKFEIDDETLSHDRVFLELGMIDTVAVIRINGEEVGRSANMFRRFRSDVKRLVAPGSNVVSVLLRSPERAAADIAASLPYPIPYAGFPVASPHRNLLRKAQCMAGWDWGPCLLTGGIYDSASLTAIDGPRIEYVTTRVRREGADWVIAARAELDCAAPGRAAMKAAISGAAASIEIEAAAGATIAEIELRLPLARVEPWWPAGCGPDPSGPRHLYELSVAMEPSGSGPERGHALKKRLGFRELEVVAAEDAAGRSLTFRVNGRDVFCKGANWVPADALPSRWTRDRIDGLLDSAVRANMNCLRAWGGGLYESEDFYDLCDEKGILVWQDFAFACALYPSSPAFLAEVEAEARHQVKRLMDRPSLALWCGNNENLGALGWFSESKRDPMRYAVDYDRLYEGTIGSVVRELDPGRTFWPSSPCAGPGEYSDNWHADGRGDMHFWSVWHEGKDFTEYYKVKPRFCSEFGFQSFPNPGTVASFAPEGERNVTSPVMEHHQRHPKGNALILDTMSRYFRMPRGGLETLYLSQVQQAIAIRTAVEYWRSLKPTCMGTLYWQLNDVWPVSSWSSLDYDGGWKLLHYEARRFFESLHLALMPKDGTIRAIAVSDEESDRGGLLTIRLRRLDGRVAKTFETRCVARSDSATELFRVDPASLGLPPEESFLEARLALDEKRGPGGPERRALAFLAEPKRCSLLDPGLAARIAEGSAGPELVLRAERPAFYVAAWTPGIQGGFEDSGFHLMPGEERRLAFVPARGAPEPAAGELAAALRIMHLRSSYE